jgi:hypothetical protein
MRRTFVALYLTFLLVSAGTALAVSGGGGQGRLTGTISVGDAVWAGTTTATVNPGGENVYVFVQCYAPDIGGKYVYARYFPVDENNHAAIGPLWSTLWPQGDASCSAQEGYFTRNGFGKWVSLAATTFNVTG